MMSSTTGVSRTETGFWTFTVLVWLTVPINKSQKFMPTMNVEINNRIAWRDEHLKKILVSYANARYFHLYRDYLENLYRSHWSTVFELDLETMRKCFEWLGISVPIIRESELKVSSTGTQRLVDVCAAVGADTYVSGRGGREYMDESLFQRNGLTLEYQAYAASPYPQRLSSSFVPDLSIIDMLANLGPATHGFHLRVLRCDPRSVRHPSRQEGFLTEECPIRAILLGMLSKTGGSSQIRPPPRELRDAPTARGLYGAAMPGLVIFAMRHTAMFTWRDT